MVATETLMAQVQDRKDWLTEDSTGNPWTEEAAPKRDVFVEMIQAHHLKPYNKPHYSA